jgi:hydrogenase expression/formation protein HypC
MCLGIPGRIVEMRNEGGLPMGVVDFGGVRREVCLAYVADEVSVGDYAVVHVGFAISKVDEDEARRTYDVLREMGELNDLGWIRDVAEAAASVEVPEEPGGASPRGTAAVPPGADA